MPRQMGQRQNGDGEYVRKEVNLSNPKKMHMEEEREGRRKKKILEISMQNVHMMVFLVFLLISLLQLQFQAYLYFVCSFKHPGIALIANFPTMSSPSSP
jgi:hypothetical protein